MTIVYRAVIFNYMSYDSNVSASLKKFRLAILASHPVPYQVPIYRELAKNSQIDLRVYFCDDRGLSKKMDPGFGLSFKWNISLLDGYEYAFLKNYGIGSDFFFFGKINPGIIPELKNGKYDAVIVTGYVHLTNWFVFLTKWFTRVPIILRGEADFLKKTSGFWKKAIKRAVLGFLFRTIDAFLYSYTLNKEYFRYYGVPEDKLFFLPCAVDNNFFQSRALEMRGKRDKLKELIGIKDKKIPTVVFTGKLISRKRPLDLLIAYDKIRNRAACNVVIVGDGPEKGRLLAFVEEKRLENVFFVGFKDQSEISIFYFIADIFVLPTEFDPSSKTINEAMNFGLAIVTSDCASTSFDLVEKGRSGFIYPMGDATALSERLEKLISNPQMRKKFGQNALATVAEWSVQSDAKGIVQALTYVSKFQQS